MGTGNLDENLELEQRADGCALLTAELEGAVVPGPVRSLLGKILDYTRMHRLQKNT